MNQVTQQLREKARELISDGQVDVIVGYENKGDTEAIPVFVQTVQDVDRLVFNERCYPNLVGYLIKPEVKALGRPAVVVKGCDSRAVNVLVNESRLKREDVLVLGIECPGMDKAICAWCDQHTPTTYDVLLKSDKQPPEPQPFHDPLEGKSHEDRWSYWMNEFSRCIKCYACRQVCPICHCTRCIAEKNQPQWVDTSSHARGNLKWNLVRAFHLIGRCVECGECERACPMGIPLSRLSMAARELVRDKFQSIPGTDAETTAPLATFRENDEEDFFL